jgi:hypothetical protein
VKYEARSVKWDVNLALAPQVTTLLPWQLPQHDAIELLVTSL